MGCASCLEPRFRSAIPDTPPEALTPDSAVFPCRQSEAPTWNPLPPPSPPMSKYDPTVKARDMSSSGMGLEETRARGEGSPYDQSAPRQQLPSLSSLFGPPSQIPPLHSPFTDRPAPYSASPSPLDRPFGGSSSSYFPPTTSATSQPRSVLDLRFQDRPQIPPLHPAFPGPLSPQSRLDHQRQENRGSEHGSGSQWPVQHEAGREYSLGSREPQLYKPAADRPSHVAGAAAGSLDDGRREGFREQQLTPRTPAAHNSPATPTSSSGLGSESVPTKDGLGPKIWTGTHFLPRFVRAAEVPGEGMCYFYDDGSHCKTVIDGEAVNAHWGVTKAGKPRKRLAIACVTCREKKIKCDPDYPRCVQCEKFGRVCKFKNAPRGGHNTSPSTPPAEPEDLRRLGGYVRPPTELTTTTSTRPGSHSSGSVSPRTTIGRPASPDSVGSGRLKRARLGGYEQQYQQQQHHHHHQQHYNPTTTSSAMPPMGPTPPSTAPPFWRHHPSHHPESLPRIHEDVLQHRPWQADPYTTSVPDAHSASSPNRAYDVVAEQRSHQAAARLNGRPDARV